MSRLVLLAALWLLALPVLGREEYARYDLALNRLMLEQTAVLLKAGTILETAADRTPAQWSAELEAERTRAEKLKVKIQALIAPPSAQTLKKGAVQAAQRRVDLIASARDYVARGIPQHAQQQAFLASSFKATGELQAQWLRDRLQAAGTAPRLNPRLQAYYRWQTQLLPLTLVQVKVGTNIQQLVFLNQAGTANLPQLIAEAGQAAETSKQLLAKAHALTPPPALKEAHVQAEREQKALFELCAAVKQYTGDRTPDSVAELKYASRQLRECSLAAEKASLDALAAALP